jgi:multicomponent Na+:H+ antiporter subunit C
LILTAIVVGVATTAVGYALIIRIQESFGTIEDDDIIVLMEDGADASPSKGEVA